MKQPIAIVGASTRAAAASAIRSGFQPLTADLFADLDLREIATTTRISPYPHGFADWLRAAEPPAWMYTGALENYPELVDQMAWLAPLWGNTGDVLERVRHPLELQATLHQAGLLFPETRSTPASLPHNATWLTKTYTSTSGSGIQIWNGNNQKALPTAPPPFPLSPSPPLFYQLRLPGTPAAAVYVASNGTAQFLGITQQLIGTNWLNSHGFQYTGSIGPLPVSNAQQSAIEKAGSVVAQQFDLIGLFGIDFMLNDEGAWAIEVNPRFTASVEIVERFSGHQAIRLHAAACGTTLEAPQRAGASPPPSKTAATATPIAVSHPLHHGKAILFAKHDVTLTQQFTKHALQQATQTPWPELADISPPNELIEAGHPILTIFARGNSVDEVEQNLKTRVVEIEATLYQ